MIEKIKKIVSEYTKISMEQLQSETGIGRSALGNSIILHRMYAAIAKEGVEVQGYQEVKTFGELVNKISQVQDPGGLTVNNEVKAETNNSQFNQRPGIGVDIEDVSKMPATGDFREDDFYKMNFTPEEIAYCILQPDQYASFTGLFAAKEAIVKADNNYRNLNFNKIFIDHLPAGKPVFGGFDISISHTQSVSVAIAIKNEKDNNLSAHANVPIKNNTTPLVLSIVSIIIALIAVCISLFK